MVSQAPARYSSVERKSGVGFYVASQYTVNLPLEEIRACYYTARTVLAQLSGRAIDC